MTHIRHIVFSILEIAQTLARLEDIAAGRAQPRMQELKIRFNRRILSIEFLYLLQLVPLIVGYLLG